MRPHLKPGAAIINCTSVTMYKGSKEKLEHFGEGTPMGHPGQPNEVAPPFLFLACEDASYISGQVLHPNGGIIVDG